MSLVQLVKAMRNGLNIQKRNGVQKMYIYVFLGLRVKTKSFLLKKYHSPWSCHRGHNIPELFDVSTFFGSSRREVFCEKSVPRNFSKFTGKHLCQSPRPAILLKKRPWHRWHRPFPVNFSKILRIPFLTKHLQWLVSIFCFCHQISSNKNGIRFVGLL